MYSLESSTLHRKRKENNDQYKEALQTIRERRNLKAGAVTRADIEKIPLALSPLTLIGDQCQNTMRTVPRDRRPSSASRHRPKETSSWYARRTPTIRVFAARSQSSSACDSGEWIRKRTGAQTFGRGS